MGERYICGTFDLRSHPDVGDFNPTDSCGKDFVSKASLIDHIRTAHLGIPSVINANRNKSSTASDDDVGVDNDEDIEQPKKTTKKQAKKPTASAIDDLLGIAEPSRNISCLVPDCPHMFIRDYDLQVHMRNAHQSLNPGYNTSFSAFEGAFHFAEGDDQGYSPAFAGGMGVEEGREEMEALYDQADIDWELQRRVLGGGPFWVGADEEAQHNFEGDQDEWTQEEMEMRTLVGDD
jgi:hypothetical protein